MTEYALIVDEHHYVSYPGCPPGCQNCGGWCDRGSTSLEIYLRAIHKERRDFFILGGFEVVEGDDIEIGQTAYPVIVSYTDGDTFGSSGYWTCIGVFANLDAADDARRECEKPLKDLNDFAGYRPWYGYFASLNSAEVYPMIVQR